MKRIRIIQIVGIVLFVIYVGLFILDLIWGVLSDFDSLILSIVLAIVSMSLIYKGVILKSGSTLWFSISLILSAIFLIIISLLNLSLGDYYYVFAILPIFASIFNLLIFGNKIYIKVIILNITILLPILVVRFYDLSIWLNILISVGSVVLGIIISRSINLSKEKVK